MYHLPLEPPSLPSRRPFRSSRSARLGPLCYTATSYQPSALHMAVYVCQCYLLCASHSLLSPLCPQVHSLYLSLHPFPANRFINTILLDPIRVTVLIYVCFSLSACFTLRNSLECHLPHLNRLKFVLFYSWEIFHRIYVPHLFFSFISISWRLITLQYCRGFCHTLTWISHGFTCVPHPDPPSHLPLHRIPLGLPSAPGPRTCLMHPTWAGDLFTVDYIHVSMLFSQIIPPSPSPTESKWNWSPLYRVKPER